VNFIIGAQRGAERAKIGWSGAQRGAGGRAAGTERSAESGGYRNRLERGEAF